MKPTLVIYSAPFQPESFFYSTWFNKILLDNFNVLQYDETVQYPTDAAFVLGCNTYIDAAHRNKFLDRRVIIDTTWESFTGKWKKKIFPHRAKQHIFLYGSHSTETVDGVIFTPNFLQYQQSLWWRSLDYHKHIPSPTYNKRFLMPIGHMRTWRQQIVDSLTTWLTDDALWSTVEHGKLLPDPDAKGGKGAKDISWQDINWYNETAFSLVLESARSWDDMVMFLTEKTYKPISSHHPFIIFGFPGSLKYLQKQGFQTFDNIFDESYDNEANFDKKLDIIKSNIASYNNVPYSLETISRIQHNHSWFYNIDRVTAGIEDEIINPIKHYMASNP